MIVLRERTHTIYVSIRERKFLSELTFDLKSNLFRTFSLGVKVSN